MTILPVALTPHRLRRKFDSLDSDPLLDLCARSRPRRVCLCSSCFVRNCLIRVPAADASCRRGEACSGYLAVVRRPGAWCRILAAIVRMPAMNRFLLLCASFCCHRYSRERRELSDEDLCSAAHTPSSLLRTHALHAHSTAAEAELNTLEPPLSLPPRTHSPWRRNALLRN